jgi:cytosine deaminase
MFDTVLREARVADRVVDIGISDGRIQAVAPNLEAHAQRELAVDGRLVVPGFIESHIHIDKAFVAERVDGLRAGGPSPQAQMARLKSDFTVSDIYERARRSIELAQGHGCTHMRAHVEIDNFVELRGLEALSRLKQEFAGLLDLELVAFAQEGLYNDDLSRGLLEDALRSGVGVLGGCPYMDPGREREHIDWCFQTAEKHGVTLDFHADTSDDPHLFTTSYIVEKTNHASMQGKVLIGHLCTLDVLTPAQRARSIESLAAADISVVSLPATESHVKGRTDPSRTWRGITRIGELAEGGVNVAVSTNNIVNPFTPYGHPDLLRQLLITAIVAHQGNLEQMANLFDLVTTNAAKAVGLEHYGIAQDNAADLVVLDATDPASAITNQCPKRYVLKGGRIVAENELRQNAVQPQQVTNV